MARMLSIDLLLVDREDGIWGSLKKDSVGSMQKC